MNAIKTYTFDGTQATLYVSEPGAEEGVRCSVVFQDSELPGGRFEFFSYNGPDTLSSEIAVSMPAYVDAGSFSPFIAGRLPWIASKLTAEN